MISAGGMKKDKSQPVVYHPLLWTCLKNSNYGTSKTKFLQFDVSNDKINVALEF